MILFDRHTEDFRIAIWNVEENIETLLAMLPYGTRIREEADRKFGAESRKKEWIAVRVLLYSILHKQVEICYTANGAPFLSDENIHISISHTRHAVQGKDVMYVAVALSQKHKVGIDIENQSARVSRVKERFIGADEKAETQTSLLLHWSAKEAAFKVLSTESVDFVRHLHIKPFQEADSGEGTFVLTESRTDKAHRMNVMYKIFPDFVLTFIITD